MPHKILITRPEPENAQTCQRLAEQGIIAVPLPMMSITPITDKTEIAKIRSQVFNIDEYNYVIFVSKNAARAAAEWLDECWPMLPEKVYWIGIGQGTTQTLIAEGIPALSNPGHTSEDLLDWLKPVKMTGLKILIARGSEGRPTLGEKLSQRGAKVSYLSLYERKKPTYSAQTFVMLPDINKIWATSGESLQTLTEYTLALKKAWLDYPLFVPSQRVAQQATQAGWKNVICADGADDFSLLKATELHTGRSNDR